MRPKTPITADGPVATFAAELRAERTVAGNPSYRQMGQRANWSHSGLSQADRGDKLPTWPCTAAYLRACGVRGYHDLTQWQQRWQSARRAINLRHDLTKDRQPRHAHTPLRHAEGILTAATRDELLEVLHRAVRSRRMTWADVAARLAAVGGRRGHPLTRQQLANVAAGRPTPDPTVIVSVVAACGGDDSDVVAWHEAIRRVTASERTATRWAFDMLAVLKRAAAESDGWDLPPTPSPRHATRPSQQPASQPARSPYAPEPLPQVPLDLPTATDTPSPTGGTAEPPRPGAGVAGWLDRIKQWGGGTASAPNGGQPAEHRGRHAVTGRKANAIASASF